MKSQIEKLRESGAFVIAWNDATPEGCEVVLADESTHLVLVRPVQQENRTEEQSRCPV